MHACAHTQTHSNTLLAVNQKEHTEPFLTAMLLFLMDSHLVS